MSLETAVHKLETEVRDGLQNVIGWGTQVIEEHLPGALADIRAVAGSKVFKLIESAVLTPAEEELVTKFVAFVTSLRTAQPGADENPPADASTGAAPSEPAPVPETAN